MTVIKLDAVLRKRRQQDEARAQHRRELALDPEYQFQAALQRGVDRMLVEQYGPGVLGRFR